MARPPKPWFWKARKAWYVTIDGTRHFLAEDKEAALTRFHQLMAEPQKRIVRSDSVAAIIDLFLDWCQKHRAPDTYEWYRYRLERFVQNYPDLRTHELRPFHVQQWLDAMSDLASGSRRNFCRSIKRAVRWAKKQGYIDTNPIVDMEQPKAGKREVVLSQDEFDLVQSLVPSSEFRDLLTVTWETGCRPQESLAVEARHVQLKTNRWVFGESEAKGDIGRVVYLTESAAAITRRLMERNPTGKLFRNTNGKPMTTESVNCSFIRLQQKMGLAAVKEREFEPTEKEIRECSKSLSPTRVVKGATVAKSKRELYIEARRKLRLRQAEQLAPKYSLYVLRHSWATHALERGVDALTVAVLMGHRDPSTLAKVYQHLAHNPEYLLEQARKAAG
jgi:site-specific recombinase XerD